MRKLGLGLFSILLIGLMVVGCSEKPADPLSNADFNQLANFILPPGATLESATFNINVIGVSGRTVNVHRITDTWGETTVTWNNFAGAFAPAVYGSFVADGAGWRSVDVTTLVQEWLDGSYENFGLLLDQADISYPRTFYTSRETTDMPYMEVCYMIGGETTCETIYPLGDTYINEYLPNDNYGLDNVLFTGWAADNELEKQSLFMFEFTPSEPELASIGDRVWMDDDQDGIQDAGEPGVPGVMVSLFDCTGALIATTTTDANGNYWFTDLDPGDYYVMFDLPSGYAFSPQNQGADDAIDSDADPTTGMAACTTLDPGENDMTWDVGVYMPEEECGYCDGKVTELTLRNHGAAADIVVETRKGSVIFSGNVAAGADFTFYGNDRHGTMGPEITVFVNGSEHVEIHTSCSQPIEIGMIFGDFEIIDGYSRNGGKLCTYQP